MAGLNELAAVNIMLGNIGETPAMTLVGSAGDAYLSTAVAVLAETTRAVLGKGWEFNTDTNYPLSPDLNGDIAITDDMVSVDSMPGGLDVTVRRGKLYNKESRTSTFTDVVQAKIIWEFDFLETPQYVRQYIAIRSARTFSDRMQGDEVGDRLSSKDEQVALADAKRLDLANNRRTMFHTGNSIGRLQNRRI